MRHLLANLLKALERKSKVKRSVFFGVMLLTCSAVSFAQPVDLRKKQHVVTRFYQAYFGPAEMCKAADPDIAHTIKLTVESIWFKHSDSIKLIMDSPYFNQAKIDFQSHNRETDLKGMNSSCTDIHRLMKTFFDSEIAPQVFAEIVETISK
jgi:hypothetical protein